MPSREYCSVCKYPKKTCLCAHIKSIDPYVSLHILQHPSELSKAKNSVRLLELCIPRLHVWLGENPEDFSPLREILKNSLSTAFCFYPSEDAQAVVEGNVVTFENGESIHLLFLDGTWKKAYKIWMLNPWLREFKTLKFAGLDADYQIRKAPKEGQLSTLECVVQSLAVFEKNLNTEALLEVFDAFKENYTRFSRGDTQ